MLSKILFITFFIAVYKISCITTINIEICNNDQEVYNNLSAHTKGIVPILIIENIDANPFSDEDTKCIIDRFSRHDKIDIMLVVPADICGATNDCLNGPKSIYPSLFMIKEGRFVPQKIIYTSTQSYVEFYNFAVRYYIDGLKGKQFRNILKKAIQYYKEDKISKIFELLYSKSSEFTTLIPGPLPEQTMAPWLVNPETNQPAGQIIEQSQPSGYPVRLTTPAVNQVSTQTAYRKKTTTLLYQADTQSIVSIPREPVFLFSKPSIVPITRRTPYETSPRSRDQGSIQTDSQLIKQPEPREKNLVNTQSSVPTSRRSAFKNWRNTASSSSAASERTNTLIPVTPSHPQDVTLYLNEWNRLGKYQADTQSTIKKRKIKQVQRNPPGHEVTQKQNLQLGDMKRHKENQYYTRGSPFTPAESSGWEFLALGDPRAKQVAEPSSGSSFGNKKNA